jgi:type II secretory pathway predicted ATPase ExeA
MNYLGYWDLFDKPFARCGDQYFFAGEPQREAIAGLSYFAASQFGAAFLVSHERCGMSHLMRHLRQMNGLGDRATEVVHTDGRNCDCRDLTHSLAQALGIPTDTQHGHVAESLHNAIRVCQRDGVKVIWLIDRLDACTLNTAKSLLATHKNLAVVLGATPGEHRRLEPLMSEAVVRIDLEPLTLDQSGQYLKEGLADVGCTRQLFQDGAIVRLHEFTSGAIADLATAAEASLAIASRYQLDRVTTAIVEAAVEVELQQTSRQEFGTGDNIARAA